MIPTQTSGKIRSVAPMIAREKLKTRTQPDARSYVNRLGYNTAVSSYTQSSEIGRLSGSSINRAEKKRIKDELETKFKSQPKIAWTNGETIDEHYRLQCEIKNLHADYIIKQRDRRRNAIARRKLPCGVHLFSQRSKGKVRDKATAFYRSCGKQRTFATLTFISQVDDRTGVTILNKFLTQLRTDYAKLKYLWVAERQEETGNIHFHVIINQRLPVRRYNSLWVLQQYNEGLRFNDVGIDDIRYRVRSETVHEILNPFDIKNIKSIYGLSFYLTKYITKTQSGIFNCLAWHCSRSVSKLFTKTIVSRSCMSEVRSSKNVRIIAKTGELRRAQSKQGAFYQLFYIENKPYFLPEMAELEKINKWILDGFPVGEVPKDDEYSIVKFYCN